MQNDTIVKENETFQTCDSSYQIDSTINVKKEKSNLKQIKCQMIKLKQLKPIQKDLKKIVIKRIG